MKIVLLFISAIVLVLGAAGCATQHGAARSDAQSPLVHQFYGSKLWPESLAATGAQSSGSTSKFFP